MLGLLQITLETVLYLALAAGVARAGTWFRRPRIRRRLEAVSGTVLVGLGLRVAAVGQVTHQLPGFTALPRSRAASSAS